MTVAIAVLALHVLDDNFVPPQPGTAGGGEYAHHTHTIREYPDHYEQRVVSFLDYALEAR